jgi:hypothetical protein
VSPRGELFLGIIAFATLITAIIQVGVLVAAGLLARRLTKLTERVERELKPVFVHLDNIGREASRTAALATAQVERIDQLLADVVRRTEATMDSVQNAVAIPIREASALLAGLRAVMSTLRQGRPSRSRRSDDEDALFI